MGEPHFFVLHQFPRLRMFAHREEAGIKVQQRHEHKHQQDSATELHVLFRRALSHSGNTSKHTPALRTGLGKEQQQTSTQSQIPEHTAEKSRTTRSDNKTQNELLEPAKK